MATVTQASIEEPNEFVILHLTDTHLKKDAALHYDSVDTVAALQRVLSRAGSLNRVDLVACSGDLSDDGSAESYALLRNELEPWAQSRGAAIVYALGNHDRPEGFRQILGAGHGKQGSLTPTEGNYGVSLIAGVRVITLDTSVATKGYGFLDPEQLSWLRGLVATPAENGTVIVLHHPPVAAETVLLNALQLRNPEDLLDALVGSDVRLILAGHYHYPLVDQVANIPVVISAGVANLGNILGEGGSESAFTGSGASIIRLPRAGGAPRVLPFSAADGGDGRQVFRYDPDTVARIIEAAG
jgi:Icc protein